MRAAPRHEEKGVPAREGAVGIAVEEVRETRLDRFAAVRCAAELALHGNRTVFHDDGAEGVLSFLGHPLGGVEADQLLPATQGRVPGAVVAGLGVEQCDETVDVTRSTSS